MLISLSDQRYCFDIRMDRTHCYLVPGTKISRKKSGTISSQHVSTLEVEKKLLQHAEFDFLKELITFWCRWRREERSLLSENAANVATESTPLLRPIASAPLQARGSPENIAIRSPVRVNMAVRSARYTFMIDSYLNYCNCISVCLPKNRCDYPDTRCRVHRGLRSVVSCLQRYVEIKLCRVLASTIENFNLLSAFQMPEFYEGRVLEAIGPAASSTATVTPLRSGTGGSIPKRSRAFEDTDIFRPPDDDGVA